jgi:hypothetical protein
MNIKKLILNELKMWKLCAPKSYIILSRFANDLILDYEELEKEGGYKKYGCYY